MTTSRAATVICGAVVVRATPAGLTTAEAVGIRDGAVVAAGRREEVLAASGRGARVLNFGALAVVPGLHDFHVHLVGLARARAGVLLDGSEDAAVILGRLRTAAASTPDQGWITGRGWTEAQLSAVTPSSMEAAVGRRAAYLTSHDGHSAWASTAALRQAHVSAATPDPAGGRIERDPQGEPTGVLREVAMDRVAALVPRLQGDVLRPHLDAVLRELAAFGVTGASEAGDYTAGNGVGADADLGDSYSSLTDLADGVDGRLRLTLGIPADALAAAAGRGHRTGVSLADRRTMRFGWAKEYADGALGSGTAALFEPRTCGEAETGILRVTPEELDDMLADARAAGIGMAVHAIGDRAAATVLDAVERASGRAPRVPRDRMEHLQLLRAADRARLAPLGVVASIQPVHAAADRDLVEACWQGRQEDAYAWRSLAASGALLALGSDAPIETVDPWRGIFAAVHRRAPDDGREDWRPSEVLTMAEALAGYTTGPALAMDRHDEGHLEPGARADLAVLDIDLDLLVAADEPMASARSLLTMVDGVVVHQG